MNLSGDSDEAAAIRAALPPALAARTGAIEIVAAIDSTNAELLRRGAAQDDATVLIADTQHAGRGRRGRDWHSPPCANLYLSMYHRTALPAHALGALGLAAGVACAEALHTLGASAARLKWPNDLLAHGRKLGGILIELAPGAAVIGIGINRAMPEAAAAAIEQPWIDLQGLDVHASRAQLAAALLAQLLPALDLYAQQGLAPFRTRWEALDAFAAAAVRLHAGEHTIDGRSLGLAADGGLRVQCDDGERVFHSADVSLRPE